MIKRTLRLLKTTRIQRERERERKESVVRSLLCVCVIEMWDDRDKKEIQKKYEDWKRGKTLLSFLVF